jgi:hypothetical protein
MQAAAGEHEWALIVFEMLDTFNAKPGMQPGPALPPAQTAPGGHGRQPLFDEKKACPAEHSHAVALVAFIPAKAMPGRHGLQLVCQPVSF